MLDLRLIREQPEAVAARLASRGPGAAAAIQDLLAADTREGGVRRDLEKIGRASCRERV